MSIEEKSTPSAKKMRKKMIFFYLKDTGKKQTGKMVGNGTGVKNWCQFIFVNKSAKNAS